jgi:hypothetical protein
MYIYAHWPHNNHKNNNRHIFTAFKSKNQAAEFAINQVLTLLDGGEGKIKARSTAQTLSFDYAEAWQAQPLINFDPLPEAAVNFPPDGEEVINMDNDPAPQVVLKEKLPPKKKKVSENSAEFQALVREVNSAAYSKTFESAIRIINLYETFLASKGQKSVLHAIQPLKVVQEALAQ